MRTPSMCSQCDSFKMATSSSEEQFLLKQILDYKRLIVSHKSRKLKTVASSNRVPYHQPCYDRHRTSSTQFPQYGNAYARNHFVPKDRSLYALNRTLQPGPRSQVPFPYSNSLPSQNISNPSQSSVRIVKKFQPFTRNLRNEPTSISTTKETLTNFPSTSAQISVVNKLATSMCPQPAVAVKKPTATDTLLEKPSQLQLTSTNKPMVTTVERPFITPTLKMICDEGIAAEKSSVITKIAHKPCCSKNMSMKPEIPILSRKPSTAIQFQSSLKLPQLKYKFVRPDASSRLSDTNRSPSSVGAGHVQTTSSKYKLIATPKKNPSKVKSPVRSAAKPQARKLVDGSKYSWSLNGSHQPKRSPIVRNIIKSRYRLSKASVGVSPKLIRRVNKYSVKYMPTRLKVTPRTPRASKPQFVPGNSFKQKHVKGKSDLVVIGGILYKSSKTKLSRTADPKIHDPAAQRHPANQQIVNVRGVRFSMDSNRKVLQRLSPIEHKPSPAKLQTSKGPELAAKQKGLTRIDIGGETYIQTRPGVLVRSNTNQLRNLANRVVNRSIFRLRASKGKSQQYCLFYNKFGKCKNKEKGLCPYIHDPEKIAICKRFLKGGCEVEGCLFSHSVCPSKMPVCTFFLHGRCNSDSCNYRHVNVNPNADICLDFAKGYCPLGEKCKNWHVSVCPQFEQTGKCDKANKCPLKHQRRVPKDKKCSEIPKQDSSSTPLDLRPSIKENATDETTTKKRRRCPSFISLESNLDVGASSKIQKVLDMPLQIKPAFLKLS